MTVPASLSSEPEGPAGHTYAALLVRVGEGTDAHEEVIATLRQIRFSGWVAPLEDGGLPVVASGEGTVASGRRGIVGVGEVLAEASTTPGLAVRVLNDRQLVLVAWESGRRPPTKRSTRSA